jgi:hypothetical protein
MEIGMADPGRCDPDEYLPRVRFRDGDLFDAQRFSEFVYDGRLHGPWHENLLAV